mmetsp:Transcript_56664/g.83155  ORF Transcript_56664/g.83155 Transcript_56664/m.83155 type:complete len:241 (-) Transcript_56664:1354-2076(-)
MASFVAALPAPSASGGTLTVLLATGSSSSSSSSTSSIITAFLAPAALCPPEGATRTATSSSITSPSSLSSSPSTSTTLIFLDAAAPGPLFGGDALSLSPCGPGLFLLPGLLITTTSSSSLSVSTSSICTRNFGGAGASLRFASCKSPTILISSIVDFELGSSLSACSRSASASSRRPLLHLAMPRRCHALPHDAFVLIASEQSASASANFFCCKSTSALLQRMRCRSSASSSGSRSRARE